MEELWQYADRARTQLGTADAPVIILERLVDQRVRDIAVVLEDRRMERSAAFVPVADADRDASAVSVRGPTEGVRRQLTMGVYEIPERPAVRAMLGLRPDQSPCFHPQFHRAR